jgi:hypothetical protein
MALDRYNLAAYVEDCDIFSNEFVNRHAEALTDAVSRPDASRLSRSAPTASNPATIRRRGHS